MGKKDKNKVIENLQIEGIAAEGKCIARHEGKVIFIDGAAPGDIANVLITKSKKSFAEGTAMQIIEPSSCRIQPFCIHFGTCGGCKWQHIEYNTQLHYKRQQVIDNLERIAKVPLPDIQPILPSKETRFYRNKLEYTFSSKRWLDKKEIESNEDLDRDALGFHIPGRFDKVLHVSECHLQNHPSNEIRNAIFDFSKEQKLDFFDLVEQKGFLRNLIIRTANTGETMVIVQFAHASKNIDIVMEFIKNTFPAITSLLYVINTKGNETFHDLNVVTYSGRDYIIEEMEGLQFRVGPKSFFQTNSQQAYELYKIARTYADLKGNEIVYDLYTGTGTIANFVANKSKKVIGIEYVPEAIKDAKINSEINNIENVSFFAGDMKDLLTDEFISEHGKPDVIITDPPRAGMHEDVVKMILKASPERIVYVSCNPATQARDIALLSENYKVTAVQPVDMFPHTHHVENVALLMRK